MPVKVVSEQVTFKQALFGMAMFVGGGVALYAVVRSNSKPRRKYRDPHVGDISDIKKDVLDLRKTLNFAVADFRRDLEGIRKSIARRNVTASGKIGAIADICSEVDRLNDGDEQEKASAMEILQDQEIIRPHEPEILWRLARAHVGYFELRDDRAVKHLHATSALEYAKSCIKLDKDSPHGQKWLAISLGILTEFLSTKEKIESGFELREHIDRAIELDPNEPVLYFMKGRWCWSVYMLTWLERKLAATLFAEPPTSSIDEALQAFQQAEDIEPGFHKENRLYIAKCYYEKGDYPNAKRWANLALALPISSKDDQQAQNDAEVLADKL